jgi:DNA repair protein RAD7
LDAQFSEIMSQPTSQPTRRPRTGRNAIRGPTSALSSFLRERGIRASGLSAYGQLTDGQIPGIGVTAEAIDPVNEIVENDGLIENGDSDEVLNPLMQPQSSTKTKSKKRKIPDADADVEEDIQLSRANHSKRRNIPGVTFCANCHRRFTFVGNEKCEACILISGKKINQAVVKKKGKGKATLMAPKLLSDYATTLPSLRDLCIKVNICVVLTLKFIADNIEMVESLGDVDAISLDKISRIISRYVDFMILTP